MSNFSGFSTSSLEMERTYDEASFKKGDEVFILQKKGDFFEVTKTVVTIVKQVQVSGFLFLIPDHKVVETETQGSFLVYNVPPFDIDDAKGGGDHLAYMTYCYPSLEEEGKFVAKSQRFIED